MYWKTASYPELSGKSKKEQRLEIQKALRYDKYITARFFGAVTLCLIFSAIFSSLIISILCSFSFYVYLLWEINGPIRTAFITYQDYTKKQASS
jgi:hypothetical protein